ncbi:MAG: arginine--tRNA ligase [Ruminococcaceae bacterium]|nr:arginine--tRNA ligase [Oscillospiraceae bacterium]
MKKLKKEAEALLIEAIGKSFPNIQGELNIFDMLEYPPDTSMGDLALPCFKLSKVLRSSPVKIAEMLSENIESGSFSDITAVNGYLNFRMNASVFAKRVVDDICAQGENYGSPMNGDGKTVVLDYSSPNVAKPFHIGHLGTTVIGHSLKLLHEFAGYKCVGINHLGDWGTQFGKLITAYKRWGNKDEVENGGIDELVRLYVLFHTEAEKDEALNDEARKEFSKLENNDEENLLLWRWFIDISIAEYKKTYRLLNIEFDSYNGESFYTDKMPAQIQVMKDKELLTIDDGASVVNLEEWNMPPCLILKRDGSTLYPTRDIAAAVYRKNTYDFEKCIYVTSAGQSLHFAQWFKVVELMGYPWADKLVHVPYGTVSINGAKLATRTGNVILLKDLFAQAIEKVKAITAEKNPALAERDDIAEAVGVGAIVFHYLSNNRMRDINFILEDALSFDGNTGPYAQYTYARTCSILEKSADEGEICGGEICEEEKELAKALALFPDSVSEAIAQYEPSLITRYILDLCAAFNRFYHNCQILSCEDESVKRQRIKLTACVRQVLGKSLELICMKKTEKI